MTEDDALRKTIARVFRDLVNAGKPTLSGWAVYLTIFSNTAEQLSEVELEARKEAFFAGAMHTFSTIMHVMDTSDETDEAYAKAKEQLDQIRRELAQFDAALRLKYGQTIGQA